MLPMQDQEPDRNPPPPAAPQPQDQPQPQRMRFHASGSEYFRIWIVNLLLSIATLGVYSAWAKVRRLQYLYACTELAGASFDYHGRPRAILKGRLVALLLFGGYNLAFKFSPKAGGVMLLVLAALMPWLLWNSLKFKLYNTSYRGLRFGFAGSLGAAYRNYLLLPLCSLLTLGLAVPFMHQRVKRFQHTQSRYGADYFSYDARVASFYKRYALFVLVALAGCFLLAFLCYFLLDVSGAARHLGREQAFVANVALGYAWIFILYPLFLGLIQNLVWNHTSLGTHRFQSGMRWRRLSWITLTNVAAIIATLGFYTPYAQIRLLRYKLESITLLPGGSLDGYTAGAGAEVAATGAGMADLMDFDLSL